MQMSTGIGNAGSGTESVAAREPARAAARHSAAGVRAVRPARLPGTLTILRTMIRNPIEGWPPEVYEAPLLRSSQVGRPCLFVMAPELVHEALVEKADIFVKDNVMRRTLGPALGEGILTANGAHWRWQRRLAAPVFRHDRVMGMVPAMIRAAEATAERWASQQDQRVDVAHEMMRTTFDVIADTMLSGAPDMDVERVAEAITDSLDSIGWPLALSLLGAPKWMPYPGSRKAAAGRAYLRGCMQAAIDARRAAGAADGADLTSLMLDASDPETGQKMSDEQIIDNLLTFIAAGHETTALALTWSFWLLSQYPKAAARLRAEVEAVAPHGVTPENIDQLVFTRQVLQEAMRLFPPAAVIVRSATEDTTLGAEPVRKGEALIFPIHAIHRHRTLWEQPDAFNPDHFSPEAVKARPRHAFMPFGGGPRICIGMMFAILEGVAILATLARRFAPEPEIPMTPEPQLRITLRPRGGMPMRLKPAGDAGI